MTAPASGRVAEFAIGGMTCAACSTRLEKVLNRQPGMQANVNLAAERARVRLSDVADEAAVVAAVRITTLTMLATSSRRRAIRMVTPFRAVHFFIPMASFLQNGYRLQRQRSRPGSSVS